MCDVIGCRSLNDTRRGLAIHKAQQHLKTLRLVDSTSVELDSLSTKSVESDTCAHRRKSAIYIQERMDQTKATEVPAGANSLHTRDKVCQSLQSQDTFQFVHAFSEQSEDTVSNDPIVFFHTKPTGKNEQ